MILYRIVMTLFLYIRLFINLHDYISIMSPCLKHRVIRVKSLILQNKQKSRNRLVSGFSFFSGFLLVLMYPLFSYSLWLLSISAKYPAVMTPEGRAMIAMPKTEEIMVTILPIVVTGYISPYPTVVREMVAQ